MYIEEVNKKLFRQKTFLQQDKYSTKKIYLQVFLLE